MSRTLTYQFSQKLENFQTSENVGFMKECITYFEKSDDKTL